MEGKRARAMVFAMSVGVAAVLGAAGPAAAQAVRVKAGSALSPPSLESITPYVALERGLFKKYGVDVEIVEFRGSPTNLKAVLAGEVDLSLNMGGTDAIVAASRGAKIRLFMVIQPVTPYHFVARKEAATSLQGLIGRNVAVSAIGAISYHIPRIVLERSGVDPDKVKYVAVGSPADRFKALVAGKVDATVVTNTEVAKLAQHPDITDLAQVPRVAPEIPYETGVAKEEYLEKNAEVVYGITKALLEANRWIAANKAGTVAIASKVIKDESPEVLARAYDLGDPRLWGVNGDITEAAYRYTVDFLLKVGYMKDPVPYEKFFDRRFVDRALKELGRQ